MSAKSTEEVRSVLIRGGRRPDLFKILCQAAALASIGLLGWIVFQVVHAAWPAIIKLGPSFIVKSEWNPNRDSFGALPFLLGTAVSSLIALGLALPLGLFIAVFLSEDFLPMPVRQFVRFVVELLAAIPSVVYGLWGIAVVIPLVQTAGTFLAGTIGKSVPIFAGPAFGNSMLTASLVLALMILPTITAISRNALVSVPHTMREGSYALGSTRWEALFNVMLPSAAPGIIAAAILALGRAMGETMAVAMLIGNSPRLTWSLLSPAGTLAGLLANQFGEADEHLIPALMYAAVLLLLLTLVVNIAGSYILRMAQRQTGSR